MSKFQENLIKELGDFLRLLKSRDDARAAHEAAVAAESTENQAASEKVAQLEFEATSILSSAKQRADDIMKEAVQESERLQKEASEQAEVLRKQAIELQANTSSSQAALVTQTYIERRAAELIFEREQEYLISLIKENPLAEDPTPNEVPSLPPLPPLPPAPAPAPEAPAEPAELPETAPAPAPTEPSETSESGEPESGPLPL